MAEADYDYLIKFLALGKLHFHLVFADNNNNNNTDNF